MDEKVFLDTISDRLHIPRDRRSFIQRLALGPAGTAFGSLMSGGHPEAAPGDAGQAEVSFVTGTDRREMVYEALKPFKNEIKKGIRGKQVIIKPNLVGNETITAVTHPDAIRGVLDFLKPHYHERILIAESTGRRYADLPGTIKHFHLYGYFPLLDEYHVGLVDLNAEPSTNVWVLNNEGHPLDIRIIDCFLDPNNYIISICRPKAHNCLVVTLTGKNVLFGAPKVDAYRHDKGRMHSAGIRKLNYNVFLLAQRIRPQLAVIDGLEGMEGNGPNNGTVVDHGIALAGTDYIAVDRVACQLMGVDPGDCGYLTYCAQAGIGQGDLSKIKIKGPDLSKYIYTYRMHDNYEQHLVWKN